MTDPTPPHRRSPMEHERDAALDYLAREGQALDRIKTLEAERDRLKVERDKYASALDDIADGLGETDLRAIGRFAPAVARAALKGEGE